MFDAVVLLDDVLAHVAVCGLTTRERAKRVVERAGARHVLYITGNDTASVAAWLASQATAGNAVLPLLVVDCTAQLFHFPLIEPLRDRGEGDVRIAVTSPSDIAGAYWFMPSARGQAAPLLAGASAAAIAAAFADFGRAAMAAGAALAVPHGAIARHPIVTAEDRKKAVHFLFGLVRKAQDTPLIRMVNRRVSYPFTRLLLPTPITPNMISIAVFFLGMLGCWILTTPTYGSGVLGAAIVLFAGYLDGCDGEIARIRLEGSKLGAWIDTIADELTTIAFLIACGLHTYHRYGWDWLPWTIWIGAACAVWSVFVIYYYLIVVSKSGNSQDYPTKQGDAANWLRMLVKRDMINLASMLFALAGQVPALYALILLGAVVTAGILGNDHFRRMFGATNEPS